MCSYIMSSSLLAFGIWACIVDKFCAMLQLLYDLLVMTVLLLGGPAPAPV